MSRLIVVNGFMLANAGTPFVGYTSISWNDGTTSRSGQSLTGLTGGIGSAPIAGDIVIISTGCNSGTNLNMQATGYTEITDLYQNDTSDANLGLYWKIMGGSPDTTFAVTGMSSTGSNIVRVMVFRGIHATPLDVAASTGGGINSGNAIVPAVTPVTAGAIIIGTAVAVAGNILNVSSAMSNPDSYLGFESGKLSQVCHGMGYTIWSGSGAEGPHTWGGATGTQSSWAAAQIALRPA